MGTISKYDNKSKQLFYVKEMLKDTPSMNHKAKSNDFLNKSVTTC